MLSFSFLVPFLIAISLIALAVLRWVREIGQPDQGEAAPISWRILLKQRVDQAFYRLPENKMSIVRNLTGLLHPDASQAEVALTNLATWLEHIPPHQGDPGPDDAAEPPPFFPGMAHCILIAIINDKLQYSEEDGINRKIVAAAVANYTRLVPHLDPMRVGIGAYHASEWLRSPGIIQPTSAVLRDLVPVIIARRSDVLVSTEVGEHCRKIAVGRIDGLIGAYGRLLENLAEKHSRSDEEADLAMAGYRSLSAISGPEGSTLEQLLIQAFPKECRHYGARKSIGARWCAAVEHHWAVGGLGAGNPERDRSNPLRESIESRLAELTQKQSTSCQPMVEWLDNLIRSADGGSRTGAGV